MPSDEKDKSRIKVFELKKIYEERERIQVEDDLVLNETLNSTLCQDVDIK